jgi:hypothetical protein
VCNGCVGVCVEAARAVSPARCCGAYSCVWPLSNDHGVPTDLWTCHWAGCV